MTDEELLDVADALRDACAEVRKAEAVGAAAAERIQQLEAENAALRKEATVVNIRETVAHALVLAYRDARREGVPPSQSFFVLGILRELDSLYERASFDPPPEDKISTS
jgi:hypothetical protein